MRLEYHLPSPAMQRWLTVHAMVSDVQALRMEMLPAMLPNIHIWLGPQGHYSFDGGAEYGAPRVSLIGPSSTAYRMLLPAGMVMVSAGFLPSGWKALCGASAAEFTDTVLDGELLWGHTAVDRLCARLVVAPNDRAAFAIVEDFLASRFSHASSEVRGAAAAIDHWIETSNSYCLDELRDTVDVSARHLQRLTMDLHGVSPKTLAMKYRSLRAAMAMAVEGYDGLGEAASAYADQAHLTRDFKRFIGWTPVAYAREQQNVTAATLAGRRRAGAVRPLALLS